MLLWRKGEISLGFVDCGRAAWLKDIAVGSIGLLIGGMIKDAVSSTDAFFWQKKIKHMF